MKKLIFILFCMPAWAYFECDDKKLNIGDYYVNCEFNDIVPSLSVKEVNCTKTIKIDSNRCIVRKLSKAEINNLFCGIKEYEVRR